jgi:hypothetical protein
MGSRGVLEKGSSFKKVASRLSDLVGMLTGTGAPSAAAVSPEARTPPRVKSPRPPPSSASMRGHNSEAGAGAGAGAGAVSTSALVDQDTFDLQDQNASNCSASYSAMGSTTFEASVLSGSSRENPDHSSGPAAESSYSETRNSFEKARKSRKKSVYQDPSSPSFKKRQADIEFFALETPLPEDMSIANMQEYNRVESVRLKKLEELRRKQADYEKKIASGEVTAAEAEEYANVEKEKPTRNYSTMLGRSAVTVGGPKGR